MFKVQFEYKEDEQYGGEGWIPKAYPMFNAASGFGLVHDVLEHFPEDEPDLAGEMKAFGSMINIRWMSGWWQPYRGFNSRTPEDNMAFEIGSFIRDIHIGIDERYFRTPPRTYKCEEAVEDIIDGALKLGLENYHKELSYDEEESPMCAHDLSTILEKMRGWMRIGYRQSVKRYYNADHDELTQFFGSIEAKVHKLSGDMYEELTVTVHPRRLEFSVDVRYPYDED